MTKNTHKRSMCEGCTELCHKCSFTRAAERRDIPLPEDKGIIDTRIGVVVTIILVILYVVVSTGERDKMYAHITSLEARIEILEENDDINHANFMINNKAINALTEKYYIENEPSPDYIAQQRARRARIVGGE